MKMFLASLLAIVAMTCWGCAAAASPSALPLASPAAICDQTQFAPPPTLSCTSALAAAAAALPAGHSAITGQQFRYGGLCPPGAPCVPPTGDQGIVIFDFASGPPQVVYVSAGAGGAVAVGTPAPYPSGY